MLAEGARLAAADGIGVRVFGAAASSRRSTASRGSRSSTHRVDRQRGGPGRRRCARAARPRSCAPPRDVAAGRSAGAGQRRLDRGDDGRGDLRPAPAAGRAAAGARRAAARPAARPRRSSSTSAPTSRSAPSTWSSSPSSAPPSATAVLGVERPRVGLLSVGEEPEKGTRGGGRGPRRRSRGADGIDFVGNVEGRDLLGRRGRRGRHRRLHRQRRAEAMEGTAQRGRRRGRATPPAPTRWPRVGGLLLRPALGGLRARAGPRHDRRRDPARPARRSPSSATAAPAPRGSPTRSASPPAASRSTRSSAPPRCSRGRRRPRRAAPSATRDA